MKPMYFFLGLFLSMSLWAREQQMAVITADTDTNTTIFYLHLTKDGDVEAMRYLRTARNGSVVLDETSTYEQVIRDGAVVEERDGYEVIKLFVENFSRENGGTIRLSHLINALRGTRRDIRLSLKKVNGAFELSDLSGKKVNRMFVKGNYLPVVGLVGVKDIVMSFEKLN